MRRGVRALWRRHPVTVAAFGVALVLTLLLGARFAVHAAYWSRHRDDALAGWMTLGYVAQSYRVDRDDLAAALGVAPGIAPGFLPGSGRKLTLDAIARETGRPVPELEDALRAAIADARADEAPKGSTQ